MSKPPRDRSSAASYTYFVTARAWDGHALFQSERTAKLFIETLLNHRQQGEFHLHEFVVMPNHFHLLLTPLSVTLERAMQLIRGGFSYRAGKELSSRREVWPRGYVDHRIRNAEDYARHRAYIHQNPVTARLVNDPESYLYSSAHSSFDLDPVPQGLKPVE